MKENPRGADRMEAVIIEYKDEVEVERTTYTDFILTGEFKDGKREGVAVYSALHVDLGRTMEIAMKCASLCKKIITATMQEMAGLTHDHEEESSGDRES